MGTSGQIRTFRDLVVWQRALDLCVEIYRITEAFPKHERYGLAAEIRNTARSVAYNIAEGHRRRSTLEYIRFLDIACGSAAELETQFLLARAVEYLDEANSAQLLGALAHIERMLSALMRKLRDRRTSASPSSSAPP